MEIFVDFSKTFDSIAFVATVAAAVIMLGGFILVCRSAKGVGIFSVLYYIFSWIFCLATFVASAASVVLLTSLGGLNLVTLGGIGLTIGGEELFFVSGVFFESVGRYLTVVGGSYCMIALVFSIFAISLAALVVTPIKWRRKKALSPSVIVYEGEQTCSEPRIDVAEVVKRSSAGESETVVESLGEKEEVQSVKEESVREFEEDVAAEPTRVETEICDDGGDGFSVSGEVNAISDAVVMGEVDAIIADEGSEGGESETIENAVTDGADECVTAAAEPGISDIRVDACVNVRDESREASDNVTNNDVDVCEASGNEEASDVVPEKEDTPSAKADGYFSGVKIRTVRAPRTTSRKVTAAKRSDSESDGARAADLSEPESAVCEKKPLTAIEEAEPVSPLRELEPIEEEARKQSEPIGRRRVRVKGGAAEQFARYLGGKTEEERRKLKSSIGTVFIEKK